MSQRQCSSLQKIHILSLQTRLCYVVYMSLGNVWQYACHITEKDRWKRIYSHERTVLYQHFSRKSLFNVFKIVTSQFLKFTLIVDMNEVHDEISV
jgi:hypothetical protein